MKLQVIPFVKQKKKRYLEKKFNLTTIFHILHFQSGSEIIYFEYSILKDETWGKTNQITQVRTQLFQQELSLE